MIETPAKLVRLPWASVSAFCCGSLPCRPCLSPNTQDLTSPASLELYGARATFHFLPSPVICWLAESVLQPRATLEQSLPEPQLHRGWPGLPVLESFCCNGASTRDGAHAEPQPGLDSQRDISGLANSKPPLIQLSHLTVLASDRLQICPCRNTNALGNLVTAEPLQQTRKVATN